MIKKDKKITNEVIANTLGVDVDSVASAISSLESKGLIKTSGGIRSIVGSGASSLPEIFIKYSYDVKPGVGPAVIPGNKSVLS